MALERRSTEHRRAEIADAALRLIATRGIAELSTRLVAEAVGLTPGALFRHFASMDEILLAVVDRVDELLGGTYPSADLPPLQRLERFVDARAATVGEHVGILRLVLSEQFALALPKEAAMKLRAAVMRSRAFLEQAIGEGQQRGDVRDDVPAAVLTTVVMGTIQVAAFEAAQLASSVDVAAPMAKVPVAARGPAKMLGRSAVREGLMRLLSPAVATPAVSKGAHR